MKKIIISPSLLEYEPDLRMHIQDIEKMLSSGIEWLHIDVMREPFIPSKHTFPEDLISFLYDEFADKAKIDFHLMVSNPEPLIELIDKKVGCEKKKSTNITIHREAYRNGLYPYQSKDNDFLRLDTGDPQINDDILRANERTGDEVYETLRELKESGYKTGVALEPGTSLENITGYMANHADMILLMTVSSGLGGQSYNHSVTEKIRQTRKKYPEIMIQVDGGINHKTLPEAVEAGANNIVIGSYITRAEDMNIPISRIKAYLESL